MILQEPQNSVKNPSNYNYAKNLPMECRREPLQLQISRLSQESI